MDKSLGSGSFATVFAATEKKTGQLVAIKRIVRAKYDKRPKLLQSVMQETNALMQLERHVSFTSIVGCCYSLGLF
jgi:serine/threonine protein kinase